MALTHNGRRFSGEYIRRQPEFQFVKSGHSSEYARVSIDLASYTGCAARYPRPGKLDGHRPGTAVGECVRRNSSEWYNSELIRPSTAGAIKIVQKVNRKYASISQLPRPKTSIGMSSSESEGSREINNGTKMIRPRTSAGKVSRQSSTESFCNKSQRERKVSSYDPDFEKSKVFLHKKNDMFSKTNQYLSAARPGVRNLQLHYTGINTEHNDRVIFADLIQASHKKNAIVGEDVYTMERRLYTKRADPSKATTFWDREGILRPPSRPKTARTIAQKKKERKDKIHQKNEKLKIGYVPRAKSLRIPSTEDMEELRRGCRYLRIDPKYQEHLYNTGLVFYSQDQPDQQNSLASSQPTEDGAEEDDNTASC